MPSSPAHACLPDPSEVPHGAADCWDGGCGVVSGEPCFKPGWILKTLRWNGWNEAGSLGGGGYLRYTPWLETSYDRMEKGQQTPESPSFSS